MITSYETSQLLAQQNQMFAMNAQRGQMGQPPSGFSYYNPEMSSSYGANMGLQATSAMRNIGAPIIGGAVGIGGMLAGLDPISMAMRGGAWGAKRAGVGALAGGLAGTGVGLAVGAGMYAGYEGIKYGAGQMLTGAQNQAFIGSSLGQNYGQMLNPMARGGQGFSRGQTQAIASAMKSVQDAWTDIGDIYKIVDKLGQQGFQLNQSNVQQFSKKMKDAVSTVKEIAKVMGTTMEEALPMFTNARKMGLYSPAQIMQNVVLQRGMGSMGFSGQQMAEIGGMGAQISVAYGALRGVGARTAMKSAYRMSMAGISPEAMIEATGEEGPAGAAILGNTFNQKAWSLARGVIGRRLIAGAMERGEGGALRLNAGKLSAFASGQMGIGEIASGAGAGIGKVGAISFMANEHRLQGELVEKAGTQLVIADALRGFKPENLSEDMARLLLKRRGGFDESQMEAVMGVMRSMKTAERDEYNKTMAATERAFSESERKMHGSWDGLKRRVSYGLHKNVGEKFQKLGEDLSSGTANMYEDLTDWAFNRWSITTDKTAASSIMTNLKAGRGLMTPALSAAIQASSTLGASYTSRDKSAALALMQTDPNMRAAYRGATEGTGFTGGASDRKTLLLGTLRNQGRNAEADRIEAEAGFFDTGGVINREYTKMMSGGQGIGGMSSQYIAAQTKEAISKASGFSVGGVVASGYKGMVLGWAAGLGPLTAIAGGVAGAIEGYGTPAKDREYLETLDTKEAKALNSLIDNPTDSLARFSTFYEQSGMSEADAAEKWFGDQGITNPTKALDILNRGGGAIRGNLQRVIELKEAGTASVFRDKVKQGGEFLAKRLSEKGAGKMTSTLMAMAEQLKAGNVEGLDIEGAMKRLSSMTEGDRRKAMEEMSATGGLGIGLTQAYRYGQKTSLKAKDYKSPEAAQKAIQERFPGIDDEEAKRLTAQFAPAGKLTQEGVSKIQTDYKKGVVFGAAMGPQTQASTDATAQMTYDAMKKLLAAFDGNGALKVVDVKDAAAATSSDTKVSNPDGPRTNYVTKGN